MHIAKWGNSLALRIPASVVAALALKAGDEVTVRVAETGVFEINRDPARDAWLQKLRAFRGRLPADFRFDREAANAR